MVVSSSKMNFKEAIDQYLTPYRYEVQEALNKAIDDTAKEAVKRLKEESAKEFKASGKHDKKYAQGWAWKHETGRLKSGAVVYGKSGTYQLAHLLENGHVTRNGTARRFPNTPAHEHIKPIADWAVNEAIDKAITQIERASR